MEPLNSVRWFRVGAVWPTDEAEQQRPEALPVKRRRSICGCVSTVVGVAGWRCRLQGTEGDRKLTADKTLSARANVFSGDVGSVALQDGSGYQRPVRPANMVKASMKS